MKLDNTLELMNYDVLYGYCASTHEWEEVSQITEVKPVPNRNRIIIKGNSVDNKKVAFQVNKDFFETLKTKFPILNK